MASLRAMVWDALRVWPRRRKEGELIAGASFIISILAATVAQTQTTPVEAGYFIWDPAEFDVYECKWRSIVSQTGASGTGRLELYNYTDATPIDYITITSGSNFAFHDKAVPLPSSGVPRLIGCRISKATGGGTFIAHASSLRVREK